MLSMDIRSYAILLNNEVMLLCKRQQLILQNQLSIAVLVNAALL